MQPLPPSARGSEGLWRRDHRAEPLEGFPLYTMEEMMAEANLEIGGMSCEHCVMRVRKAVDRLAGVSQTDVSVGAAKITYDETRVKKEELADAIEKAGYRVVK